MKQLVRYWWHAVVTAIAVLSATPASAADYTAIAWSEDGKHWGWARDSTQKLADKAAVQGCNKSAPLNDCKVAATKAVVRASGEGRVSVSRSDVSLADARKVALQECGREDCKVTDEFTTPGFYAVAGPKEKGSNSVYYVTHEYRNSDTADKDAIAGCERNLKRACRLVFTGAIPGKVPGKASSPSPVPAVQPAAANCRPKTQQIRCTSQCVNGNCVITYENGCRMRVQVQPEFDPFSRKWEYPAPSC